MDKSRLFVGTKPAASSKTYHLVDASATAESALALCASLIHLRGYFNPEKLHCAEYTKSELQFRLSSSDSRGIEIDR